MTSIFKNNFRFIANRFEEWQGGRCLSQGAINCEILAETTSSSIHIELNGAENLKISKSFGFEFIGSDVLLDRVQYVNATYDINPIVPIVCHLFYDGNIISYVRFAMSNPDRIIEFYGSMVELGQSLSKHKESHKSIISISAEQILEELQGYGMLNKEAIMERAVKIYNDYSGVQSIDDALAIIESLKLFVKVNELESVENDGITSTLKPKILMFIALCNYKIDNINEAYCIAKQGLDAVEAAINDSSMLIGIQRSVLGSDSLKEIINTIESNCFDDVKDADYYWRVNANEIQTSRFEQLAGINLSTDNKNDDPSSPEFIITVIRKLDALRMQLMQAAIFQRDKTALMSAMMLHDLASSVFYAWEYYGYGHISDFWKEDVAINAYNRFKTNVQNNIKQQYILFTNDIFPLKTIDKDGSIQESMTKILAELIEYDDMG